MSNLNLVMTETTKCCILAINMFGLLNKFDVLFRDSYLRMDVWKDILEGEKGMTSLKSLSTFGNKVVVKRQSPEDGLW